MGSHKLASVCEYFDVDNAQAHRAMSDVLATKDVFGHLYGLRREQELFNFEDALRLQKAKIVRN